MIHPWSMQVSFRLDEHGWSDLDLWIGDTHKNFCVTHVFNSPLEAIAYSLIVLLRGGHEAKFELHEEPGLHIWQLSRVSDQHHLLDVSISSHEDNFNSSRSPFEVTTFTVARDFFIASFTAELEKISAQLSFPRFAKDRDSSEFPWNTLKQLRQLRATQCEQDVAPQSTTR